MHLHPQKRVCRAPNALVQTQPRTRREWQRPLGPVLTHAVVVGRKESLLHADGCFVTGRDLSLQSLDSHERMSPGLH